jgi:hypothetical protein
MKRQRSQYNILEVLGYEYRRTMLCRNFVAIYPLMRFTTLVSSRLISTSVRTEVAVEEHESVYDERKTNERHFQSKPYI